MNHKVRCTCGAEFQNETQWRSHWLIGRPSLIHASRLTGITQLQADDRAREQTVYDHTHRRRFALTNFTNSQETDR